MNTAATGSPNLYCVAKLWVLNPARLVGAGACTANSSANSTAMLEREESSLVVMEAGQMAG